MEWKDLSMAARCVLERCWGIHTDAPSSFSVELGKVVYKDHKVTEDTFLEIMKYQKHFPYFNAKLENYTISVEGIDQYGSWLNHDK
jgi:hypothetical protein